MTESFSLWLLPTGKSLKKVTIAFLLGLISPPSLAGPLAARLQREIAYLASRPNAPSDAPDFPPHVTLIGGVTRPKAEVLATAERLAGELAPIDIAFDRVSAGQIFYQCVYVLAAQSAPLMAAGAAAKVAFGLPKAPYMPHLSLIYSDIDAAAREALAAEEQVRLFGGTGGSGGGDSDGPLAESERGFTADSVAVWYTPGEDKFLESWRAVAVFPLTGTNS
jgi:hypothetical protein